MTAHQLKKSVEKALKPLIGQTVKIGESEGLDESTIGQNATIVDFELNELSGLLNIKVRTDKAATTVVTIDELI